jgi:hypothetical protein
MQTQSAIPTLSDAEWALCETRRAILLQIFIARYHERQFPDCAASFRGLAKSAALVLLEMDRAMTGDLRARVWAASSFEYRRMASHHNRTRGHYPRAAVAA